MIINKLKQIAKEFDLEFNKNWFKHIWISKKENILLEYIWMCPDPVYQKYGKNPLIRAKQIENFLSSKDFEGCLNRYGGQMVDKKNLNKYFLNWTNQIENLEIRKFYKDLYNKTKKSLGNYQRIAILTKSNKKNEIESLKSFVLFHEWIHILVEENDLRPRNWKYNEGLVIYFQEFAEGRLNKLEEGIKKWEHYNFQKQYFIHAIKFRELLKGIKEPEKRKQKILQLVKKYSK